MAYKSKVLLLDDDETMVGLLTTLLEIEGYEVSILKETYNIMDFIRLESPEIVFLDVHIKYSNGTEFSGFDILEAIREDKRIQSTKVILSSGMDVSSHAKDVGADGFLMKPFAPDDLIKMMRF
ncbi:MAG: response regulator [Aliifodinibius sp.]|nr:response regulator [candidate division Zixibacteria bacterium]NIS47069.1 response regulator [candidate division Zixibacteria bacterium]NIT58715.1 response regulator [Fodinibius sp.]NIV07279.1 response regulator [candidate division Zixibacteria bacterium]NIY27298.1 response regulator [Fodinibius sp.]